MGIALIAVAISPTLHADEALSRQLQALRTAVSSYDANINALNTAINKMSYCSNKGEVYSPKHPSADKRGCITIVSEKSIDDRHQMVVADVVCTRGGHHRRVAACPAGYRLTGCSGGAGDLYESGESFHIRPQVDNGKQSCVMNVYEPACTSIGRDASHVSAFCSETAKQFKKRGDDEPEQPDYVEIWTLPPHKQAAYNGAEQN